VPGGGTRPKSLLDYNVYMAKYVSPWAQAESATAAPAHSPESSPPSTKRVREGGRGDGGWIDGWRNYVWIDGLINT